MAWSSSKTEAYAQGTAPTIPAAGETFIDPVFGTEIMRVTDENTLEGHEYMNRYGYWTSLNADNTKLLAYDINESTTSRIFDFDPDTFTLGSSIQLPSGITNSEYSFVWSRVDPNIAYGVNGLQIRKLDLSAETPAWTTLHTLDGADLTAGAARLSQINISDDDAVMSATVQNGSNAKIAIAAFRPSVTKEVYYADAVGDHDEVQVDKSGQYLVHKTGDQGTGTVIQARIITIADGNVEELEDDAPDYAPGHSDNGNGIVVGADNYRNSIVLRDLSDPQGPGTELITDGGTWDYITDHHTSMRMATDDWVLLSFFAAVSTTRYNNEIFFLNTATTEVRRFVKHYSGTEYNEAPKASVSMDGKFVTYTSSVAGRIDLYIAKVPADMGIWESGEEPPPPEPEEGSGLLLESGDLLLLESGEALFL